MRIARSTAFLMWLFVGANCTTVLLFCNDQFNSIDASFSIILNIGACPAFYTVLYTTSYVHNMSASLLVLICSTKISFVSYAYINNMYCIPLLLVTKKLPVKHLYILPVSGFSSHISTNTPLFS